GEQRRVEVDLEKSTSLPAYPVEARLPLASVTETLNLGVEVLTQRLEGGPAVLATGQTTAEVSAQAKKTELTISLSLNPDFDWDLDGDPDLHDCEPDDPNVFHGAVDVCDGVRTACEDFCFIPLEDAHFVRDLACSTVERKCAAVLQGGEGVVHIYDPSTLPVKVELREGTRWSPLGLAWNDATGDLMVVHADKAEFFSSTGEKKAGALEFSSDLDGKSAISSVGSFAVVSERDRAAIRVFNPAQVASSGSLNTCTSGTNPICTTVAVDELLAGGPSAGRIIDIALIHEASGDNPLVYLAVSEETKLAFLRFSGLELSYRSGWLSDIGATTIRSVARKGSNQVLV